MRFSVLGSGSKGNALVVQGGDTTLLIDCGLTPKVLRARLSSLGLQLADLSALAITHAHGDHVAGAARVAGPFRLLTYATQNTQRQLSKKGGLVNYVEVKPGEPFLVGALQLTAVALPHDAPGCVAYVVEHEGERLGICSDLGHPTDEVAAALGGCHTLQLEFNYDEDMLWGGPYPPRLKRRVAGELGHLSNAQASDLLGRIDTSRLVRLLLSHLSEVNNAPRLALEAAREVLGGTSVRLLIAPQYEPTCWLPVAHALDQAPTEAAPPPRAKVPVAGTPSPPPPPSAARERIVASLRSEASRPAPVAARPSIAVRRQLSFFTE
jgi:phosphoribosyl 1,2-cyclic phosphodiesterase